MYEQFPRNSLKSLQALPFYSWPCFMGRAMATHIFFAHTFEGMWECATRRDDCYPPLSPYTFTHFLFLFVAPEKQQQYQSHPQIPFIQWDIHLLLLYSHLQSIHPPIDIFFFLPFYSHTHMDEHGLTACHLDMCGLNPRGWWWWFLSGNSITFGWINHGPVSSVCLSQSAFR